MVSALLLAAGAALADPPAEQADVTDFEVTSLGKALLEAGGTHWFQTESEHFICHALSEPAATAAVEEAEFAYRKASVYLGSEPAPRRGHLFVVEDRGLWNRILHDADRRKDSLAAQSRNDVFVLREGSELANAKRLPHEIVHFRLWQQYGDGVPVWLDEGLAGYIGWNVAESYYGQKGSQLVRTLPQLAPDQLLSLDDLTGVTEYPPGQDEVQAFCRQAEELIRAIAERRGDVKLGALAKAVAGEQVPWRVYLRDGLGYSDEDFARLSDLVRERAQEGEGW